MYFACITPTVMSGSVFGHASLVSMSQWCGYGHLIMGTNTLAKHAPENSSN
jgi:hypothetical protein